jgi:DHA1 family bicyclomycin/chloramphenicol resistance-like MFS transporter
MAAPPRSFAFYAVVLGTLTMMMPLGTDIFLASLPAFAREYGISMGQAEFALSAFFAGSALGQILWGPLSDRFGRKRVAMAAVSGYFIAAASIALSDSFAPVIFWRFIQGISAASGRIVGNAIARDLYERERLAKLIAFTMTFGSVSAMLTVPIGGWIAGRFDWQITFIITATYAAGLLLMFSVLFKETIAEKNPLAIDPVPMLLNFAMIARDRVFMSYVMVGAGAWAGMSGYINSSPGLLIRSYGVTPQTYGLVAAVVPAGFLIGAILVARYAERVRGDRFLLLGSACVAVGGIGMLGFALFGLPHPLALPVPMVPYALGFACLIPQSAAGALTPFGRLAGTAASLQGFIQAMIGATVTLLLGMFNNGTLYPMAITVAVSGLATLAAYRWLVRPLRRPPFPQPPH